MLHTSLCNSPWKVSFCKHCYTTTAIRAGFKSIQGSSSSDTSIVGMPIRGNWIISVYLLIPHICSSGGWGEYIRWRRSLGYHQGFMGVFSQRNLVPGSLHGTSAEKLEPRRGKTRACPSLIMHRKAETAFFNRTIWSLWYNTNAIRHCYLLI